MLMFKNQGALYTSDDRLPELPRSIDNLYLDFETASDDSKLKSLSPWRNCRPILFAATWDDRSEVSAVEWSHPHAQAWLACALHRSKRWVNHNVKYDAHVWANSQPEPLCRSTELFCTLNAAKLIDSDRFRHNLESLTSDWLKQTESPWARHELAMSPYLHKNHDFGEIPVDVLADYCCEDIGWNRKLYAHELAVMPEESQGVLKTEIAVTRLLWKMERRGVRVDPADLKKREFTLLATCVQLELAMHKLVGRAFRPHVNEDCYDVLCVEHGLPVVEWTDAGAPSFDKHALKTYLNYPGAPVDLVKMMLLYRQTFVLMNTFVTAYLAQHIDGVMHPTFKQCVRTGRLACSDPNMQQLSKAAKELIIPRIGHSFLSTDASQIEFRTIVHYIQDSDCIRAYRENPDTDFHQWVADMCGIKRRPAKTVNFSIGFGCGKEKTIAQFMDNEDVVADVRKDTGDDVKAFRTEVRRRGEEAYAKYHSTLPGVKLTSRRANAVAYQRGYVRNLYGRRRTLPKGRAHIAFNALNQSSAADLVKERMVALDAELEGTGAHVNLQVHDEILLEGPSEVIENEAFQLRVIKLLELPSVDIRVPVRWTVGVSSSNWRAAGDAGDGRTFNYPRNSP